MFGGDGIERRSAVAELAPEIALAFKLSDLLLNASVAHPASLDHHPHRWEALARLIGEIGQCHQNEFRHGGQMCLPGSVEDLEAHQPAVPSCRARMRWASFKAWRRQPSRCSASRSRVAALPVASSAMLSTRKCAAPIACWSSLSIS